MSEHFFLSRLFFLGIGVGVLFDDVPLPVIGSNHAVLCDGLLDYLAVLIKGHGTAAARLDQSKRAKTEYQQQAEQEAQDWQNQPQPAGLPPAQPHLEGHHQRHRQKNGN